MHRVLANSDKGGEKNSVMVKDAHAQDAAAADGNQWMSGAAEDQIRLAIIVHVQMELKENLLWEHNLSKIPVEVLEVDGGDVIARLDKRHVNDPLDPADHRYQKSLAFFNQGVE